MYKNQYLNSLLNETKNKYSSEPEFIEAVEEFFDSMDYVVGQDERIEKNAILERLIVPERIITFRIPWVDDNGKIQVNTGYRVQFNSAIGPYKGGMRFDKSVDLSILKFLGFEQTFKNSLTGLPLGGGKGGSDFDPHGKSDGEVMRFCQALVNELYRHIGPNTDVPAGDLGCGAREIGYMFGQYKKLTNSFDGAFTSKCPCMGGSLLRAESTGYGLIYFAEEMLKTYTNESLKGKRIIISGCGKVGKHALIKANEKGCIVVGMSDTAGCIADSNGLDVKDLIEIIEAKEKLTTTYYSKHKECKFSTKPQDLWQIPCDIALPCATQKEINIDSAKALKNNGCKMVVEGANMPTELEAIRYFNNNGVYFAPGKASNAGGVAVSGLEMNQNASHVMWTKEEVDLKLKEIMSHIFAVCYKTACEYGEPHNLALGANIAGFTKVFHAMLGQGVC